MFYLIKIEIKQISYISVYIGSILANAKRLLHFLFCLRSTELSEWRKQICLNGMNALIALDIFFFATEKK